MSESLTEALVSEVRAQRRDALSGPDSPAGRELGLAVGKNVLQIREERQLDREAVARRTGIRTDLLEALETGGAVPSLRAVWNLATGLEVPFGRSGPQSEFVDLGGAAHADDTFEHITMLRGTLTVTCEGKTATLHTGDTLFFRADLAHTYHNPEAEDAVAHLVMSYRPS